MFVLICTALPHENIWRLRSENIDEDITAYYQDSMEHPLPGVFITFPCTHDPQWATRSPGISNAIVIAEAPYEIFSQWSDARVHKRGGDYEQLKETFAHKMFDELYRICPQVQGTVVIVVVV